MQGLYLGLVGGILLVDGELEFVGKFIEFCDLLSEDLELWFGILVGGWWGLVFDELEILEAGFPGLDLGREGSELGLELGVELLELLNFRLGKL